MFQIELMSCDLMVYIKMYRILVFKQLVWQDVWHIGGIVVHTTQVKKERFNFSKHTGICIPYSFNE